MTKQERIKRKLERMEQAAQEAHAIAETLPGRGYALPEEQGIAAVACDAAARVLADWERLEETQRMDARRREREARELAELGRCTKCDTGAAANHRHCRECGWSMYAFGSRAEQCHNETCALYERDQEGVLYSDRKVVA